MQDANLNLTRIDDLMNTINEARKSLQNWQDKRTEALIHLDSFTFDIKRIEEERQNAKDTISSLQREIENQTKIYQSHISDLTDQMQLLKLETENLKSSVVDKDVRIETLEKEVENQKLIRDQERMKYDERLSEAKGEVELRLANQIFDLKMRNEGLASELKEIMDQRNAAAGRADRVQQELDAIRNQVLNVLHTKSSSDETPTPPPAPRMDMRNESAEPKRLKAVEVEAPSVDEYLKRLGY